MSDSLILNDPAPDFVLSSEDGSEVNLSSFKGKSHVLIFFYPGDFTPVCTAEVCAFRDDYKLFQEREISIVGISSDPVEKHMRFAKECKIPFKLLSDPQFEVAKLYGARGLLGMRRAYYLVSIEGRLIWQHSEVLPIFKLSNQRMIAEIDQILPQDFRPGSDHDTNDQIMASQGG